MKTIAVLDYFLNKNFNVTDIPDDVEIKHWDKIAYFLEEKWTQKESIGIAIWYPIELDRKVPFSRKLTADECLEFAKQQDFALKLFPMFKKKFKANFQWSKPVTARYNPITDQLYFYFFSEERYVFGDFVKELRSELGKNIFLFQVWARDMMRIDPNAAVYTVWTDCWMAIACQWYGPLPSVEVENIAMQWLDWRDIERLKWRCWKLKCSLLYELDIYLKESKDFPERWSSVMCPGGDQKGIVSSYNIITKEVVIKTEEWWVLRVPLSLLKSARDSHKSNVKEEKKS